MRVPAGTVRDGELPEQAVLREAFEETALHGPRIERYLGVAEWDMRPHADAVHVRNTAKIGHQRRWWAVPTVTRSVTRFLRDCGRLVRPPSTAAYS
ncbi:NUDIX domain-containing protein [Micromonospora sp. NPDC051543]|uniref:NUDIX domain-containing protein n=1 Tax=Micromonospora sp. NPDC051543 TaxID=3364287 RepID=UPI0037B93490